MIDFADLLKRGHVPWPGSVLLESSVEPSDEISDEQILYGTQLRIGFGLHLRSDIAETASIVRVIGSKRICWHLHVEGDGQQSQRTCTMIESSTVGMLLETSTRYSKA